jgi:exodeoxyribonuclease-3
MKPVDEPMRVVGWNVNGLRACIKKGFVSFLESSGADIVALQEVRAFPEQLPPEITNAPDWHASLGDARFDDEGRFIVAHFGRLSVASVYFPKGNGKERDNSRVEYKLDFYRAAFDRLNQLRRRGRVYVLGDFNTAHHEIDLARPKGNHKASGFLPVEREMLTQLQEQGWVDTFRAAHPNQPDHYTWWRQFGGARENNVGWRIDAVYASPSAAHRVTNAFIWPEVLGSDHCPVGVDLK